MWPGRGGSQNPPGLHLTLEILPEDHVICTTQREREPGAEDGGAGQARNNVGSSRGPHHANCSRLIKDPKKTSPHPGSSKHYRLGKRFTGDGGDQVKAFDARILQVGSEPSSECPNSHREISSWRRRQQCGDGHRDQGHQ